MSSYFQQVVFKGHTYEVRQGAVLRLDISASIPKTWHEDRGPQWVSDDAVTDLLEASPATEHEFAENDRFMLSRRIGGSFRRFHRRFLPAFRAPISNEWIGVPRPPDVPPGKPCLTVGLRLVDSCGVVGVFANCWGGDLNEKGRNLRAARHRKQARRQRIAKRGW